MSAQPATQDQVDALFGAEPRARSRSERVSEVQVYDFRRPSLISRDRSKVLEAMYGRVAALFESWLAVWTRSPAEVAVDSVDQTTFGEYGAHLPERCTAFVYDVGEQAGYQSVVELNSDLAYYLVDRLLGGMVVPIMPDRVQTPLERMVVRLAADRLATALDDVWQEHVRLRLSLARFESATDMIQIAPPEDPVLVAKLNVTTPDVLGRATLCLPFNMLDRFFTSAPGAAAQRVRSAQVAEQVQWRRMAGDVLKHVPLEIAARLPTFRIPLRFVSSLRPDTVLQTGLSPDAEVTVLVQGKPRFTARAGRVGNHLSLRISENITRNRVPEAPETRKAIVSTELTAAQSGELAAGEPHELANLLDLTLPISIELGRTSMTIQRVLDLTRGSVIQLDRLVGEPIDIYVGERRFAQGEVVVLGEEFGVRVTRIVANPTTGEKH